MNRGEGAIDAAVAAKGLEATDRFMSTFNTRDPRAWADSLNYPHVRPAARGGDNFALSAEEYAAGVDYSRITEADWDHSEWESKEVIHAQGDKAHVAGRYSRINTEGKKLWTNQVTYVATEVDGTWGIQARFPAGFTGAPESDLAESEAAARRALDDFMAAFNARDAKAWAMTLNYPHVRVASGAVRLWDTPKEYASGFRFEDFIAHTGWHRSEWGSVRVLQCGAEGVNAAVVFNRFDEAGDTISTYDALYLVTKQDGHWGIRARSSFAP